MRHATYSLLARLFLAPPDAELLRYLATLPPFDATLRGVVMSADSVESYQVAYQELFGFNFFPYESLFQAHDLMVNSASAHRLARLMATCGFDPTPYDMGAADHLGIALAFMAHLIVQETSDSQGVMDDAHRHQATLIHQHLARWVPIAMLKMRMIAPTVLYQMVAELTLELVLVDVAALSESAAIVWLDDALPSVPAENENEAEPEEEGLTGVIRQLITPIASGVFLTRADLRTMARQLHLPMTMGDRFGMLKQLFEAAGQFEQVAPLLNALDHHWAQSERDVTILITSVPAWHPYGRVWLERLAQGRTLLATLRTGWEEEQSSIP